MGWPGRSTLPSFSPSRTTHWKEHSVECGLFTCANLFAGHATITNYLLNYFPGLDLERRNVFGFTALMKAAMQGRTECVRALMLAGMSPPSCVVLGTWEMWILLP